MNGAASDVRVPIELAEISQRLHTLHLPAVDVVVAVATGGLVPGAMLAHQLGVPMGVLWINYRQPGTHVPVRAAPAVVGPVWTGHAGRVLLVDDVSVTGKTLEVARGLLPAGAQVTTLVLKGRADVVVFPGHKGCVQWPWSVTAAGELA